MSRGYSQSRSESPEPQRIKGVDFMAAGPITKMKAGRFPEERERRPSKVLESVKNKPLEQTEKVFGYEPIEHAAVFKNGKQLFLRTDDSPNSVNFTLKELNAMKDAVFTHNHPLVDGIPLPFSRADILMMRDVRTKEYRVSAGNTTFIMSPPKDSKFWKTNFKKLETVMEQVLSAEFKRLKVPGASASEAFRVAKPADAATALETMLTFLDKNLNIGYKKLKS